MKILTSLSVLTLSAMAAGCATAGTAPPAQAPAPTAKAGLMSADGQARGDVTITEAADGLHVVVKAIGLTPGIHAVHIHAVGMCTGPDFTSAGGHWNPTKHQHGKDNPMGMHMGDMPNLQAGPDGIGEIEYVVPGGKISTGDMPLLDADAQADDYKSDPAGNAGGRIACGVISAS